MKPTLTICPPSAEHNKNRPTDRIQIDPRVVIGVALPTGYRPVAGSLEFIETGNGASSNWRGIRGSVPL